MREFVEVWRSGEALPAQEVIALVRRFTLGCVEVLLRGSGVKDPDLATLRYRAFEKYLMEPDRDRIRYYTETPQVQVAGYRLYVKAFSERFQPFERIMLWPTESSVGISLRVNLHQSTPEGHYRIGPVFVGLLWWNSSVPAPAEERAYQEALTRQWEVFEQSPIMLPQQEAWERHYLGARFTPEDWIGSEADLITYIGNLMSRAVVVLREQVGEPNGDEPRRDASSLILDRLRQRGYRFSPEQIATFYGALKAKGFVILSGLSGTGKTKLAQEFAAAMGLEDRLLLEPVKPDWRDNTGLLGYWNPVTGQYEATRFLRTLLAAAEEYEGGEPPAEGDSLESYIRRRLREPATQERLRRHREMLQAVREWRGSWTDAQLQSLWLDWENGIGRMRPREMAPVDFAILRRATDIVVDRRLSLAQRAVKVIALLREAGIAEPPRVRIIRALAAFEPTTVPAIGARKTLRRAARALGSQIRLSRSTEEGRWTDLEEAWHRVMSGAATVAEAIGLDPHDGAVLSLIAELADKYEWARRGATAEAEEPDGGDEPEAEPDAPRPYFIVLDEMNLARVEYYLADILSVLESGRQPNGFTRGEIALHGQATAVRAADGLPVPPTLRLPPNLYLIGTINTDETTFAFSPKVLDRAFTLEVREVDLTDYPPVEEPVGRGEEPVDEALLADFTRQGRFAQLTKADVAAWSEGRRHHVALLDELNRQLLPHDLGFGYRVVDEILAFVGALAESPLGGTLSEEEAFDAAMMMKVLPKFHGPRNRLEAPLQAVIGWAGERFGRTRAKAEAMLERAKLVGHARFS